MAFNYYEGWSEAELLAERRLMQNSLATGRTTEVRLAGESTSTNSKDAASVELTLQRIAYALHVLYLAGETEDRVYSSPYGPRITQQSHF